MYGIFMECWVALKLYGGNGVLLLMFLAAAIYIVASEKDIKKKIVLGILPLVILAGFLFPVTKIVYVALFDDGSDTYYRILWLIPMYVVIGYGACKAVMNFKKDAVRRGMLALILLIIAVTGSFVYANQYMSKAENLYHIPQNVIDICDVIAPEDGEPRVRAAFPSELVHFVRQYNTDILMPYGREMVVTQWDYYNAVYEVMEKPETIDATALLEATRQTKCRYIVLSDSRQIDQSLEELGLNVIANIDGYTVYEDEEVSG
ncbi:hypothetical protein SAMN04487928_11823 [Butyrivibrio proteoclasticus]|uniref:Uncharacterized protein n=1 Tax=Butyrivibrio proteoclasticus TaxID=43305 RepID=A0A1I5VN05_9FIRM|nr:hypothetical protein [Butyrivibrio proteoclasticus]SFQ08840.1 hypothetical protein SAMN04487928_11823 [Butyrivibrio proteoclasticus]